MIVRYSSVTRLSSLFLFRSHVCKRFGLLSSAGVGYLTLGTWVIILTRLMPGKEVKKENALWKYLNII